MYLGPKIVHECLVTLVLEHPIPTHMEYRSDFMFFRVLRMLPKVVGKMS